MARSKGTRSETNEPVPVLHRVLWKAGVDLPLPSEASFATNVAVLGVPFALIWGAMMFVWNGDQSWPLLALVLAALVAGAIFGVSMALYYRSR